MNKCVTFYDRSGNRIVKHIRAKSQREFVDKCNKIQAELNHAPLLVNVIEEWKEHHFPTININTQNGYIAPIKSIEAYFDKKHLDEIKPLDIDRFLQELLNDYNMAKQTIKLRLIVLNQVYNYAILQGYVENNPCVPVRVPQRAFTSKRELPPTEDINLVKSSVSVNFGLYPFFVLYTGCRKCEILALRYEDIDFEKKTITINKTIVYDGNEPIVQLRTKSDAGDRIVPLLPPLENALPKRKRGLIFANDKNEPLNKSQFKILWNKYRKESGVNLTVHQLRHFYATELNNCGINLKDAAFVLGHSDISTTANIYQHMSEEHRNELFKKLREKVV